MPLLKLTSLADSDVVISDVHKSFPQVTLLVDATDQEVTLTGTELEAMGPTLERLRIAEYLTYTIEGSSATPDTLESLIPLSAPQLGPGLAVPMRVRTATTANMAAFTGVSTSLNGLTLVAGNRVLVCAQSTPAQNGIYVVGTVTTGTAPWTRAADMATAAVLPNGTLFMVDAGTTVANRVYKVTNAGTITVGTTSLTFERLLTSAELAAVTNGAGAALVGIEDAATLFTAANVEAALAEVKLLADAAVGVVKRTVTVAHGDLTGAVNGTAQAINIGATLPANARIAYVDMHTFTPFTGGAVSAVSLDIGSSGDVDAIVDGADVLAAAVDGGPSTMTKGIRPNKRFATIGAQLLATFIPDGGNPLVDLTAGAVTIDVYYFVSA
ncbi:MAG: hypothetical protein H0U59_04205 [Gemmatimonadaceae bacterium]|nr:hypothetical protein [Gemmatimonadaceae bacterium]